MTHIMGMKAISIHQPYAGLIATGAKTIETRSYPTNHRGPILICSTQRWHPDVPLGHDFGDSIRFTQPRDWGQYGEPVGDPVLVCVDQSAGTWNHSLPLGHALGVAELSECLPIVHHEHEIPDGPHVARATDGLPYVYRWPNANLWGCTYRGEVSHGDFAPGNYGWMLENFQPLDEPIPVKGQQQIWTVKESNLRSVS